MQSTATTTPIVTVLSIAGSDSGAGAGIQADLKTFHQHGVYGVTAVTVVTAQDTTGVGAVQTLPPALVRHQIERVIHDFEPRAVKTGLLGGADVIEAVAACMADFDLPLVVDPVGESSSGTQLTPPEARRVLVRTLVPRATLVTPNESEVGWVCGGLPPREWAAKQGVACLVTGGDAPGDRVIDRLHLPDGRYWQWNRARVQTRNTHGTGCTLSAAIAAALALGLPLVEAVDRAIRYVHRELEAAASHRIGAGCGPLLHGLRPSRRGA